MFGSMERRKCIFKVEMRMLGRGGILYVWLKKEDGK